MQLVSPSIKVIMNLLSKTLDYSDVVLQPSTMCGMIESRDNISTEINFVGFNFKNPVIPANMVCTINRDIAKNLANNNYFYILHRFEDYNLIFNWIKENPDLPCFSISLGVKEQDYLFIDKLITTNTHVDFITIDVSHGHHLLVHDMVSYIRQNLPNVKIIAGNITTKKAAQDYKKWGVYAAKVGLSRGKACSTYNKTGVGSFMFSAIKECASVGLPVIADGGIREIKDISIALVAGASMVMVGSLFAALEDSPADVIKPYLGLDTEYKLYYGSASAKNKGYDKYIEGQEVWLDKSKETYLEFHNKIEQGIKSTMSFANLNNISELNKMKYLYK